MARWRLNYNKYGSTTTAARARTKAIAGENILWLRWLHAIPVCSLYQQIRQGSPRATFVNVEEQVDLLLPSLISGVVSSSMVSSLKFIRTTSYQRVECGSSTGAVSLHVHVAVTCSGLG